MKVFFILIIFSSMLATCQGQCLGKIFPIEFKDGKIVLPSTCIDEYDGREHLIGSTWNTARCLRCECDERGMSCCDRLGIMEMVEGCAGVANPITCQHEYYKIDDPSQRCHV